MALGSALISVGLRCLADIFAGTTCRRDNILAGFARESFFFNEMLTTDSQFHIVSDRSQSQVYHHDTCFGIGVVYYIPFQIPVCHQQAELEEVLRQQNVLQSVYVRPPVRMHTSREMASLMMAFVLQQHSLTPPLYIRGYTRSIGRAMPKPRSSKP